MRLYDGKSWLCMRRRCNCPDEFHKKYYSGIKVCSEWNNSLENKYKFMDVKYIDGGTELCLVVNNDWYYPLKYLFKTKAEAEHYLHHANITRTETLPFLTWEEFDNGDKLIRFKSKNGACCKLEGYFNKDTNSGFIDVVRNGHCLFSEDYTEENFYKAYDECVRLFKEEE